MCRLSAANLLASHSPDHCHAGDGDDNFGEDGDDDDFDDFHDFHDDDSFSLKSLIIDNNYLE